MKAARCCRSCTTSRPSASLAFYTADNSEADFASGIGAARRRPAPRSIADDRSYFDEPFFQDGIVAQAIDTVEAQGVAYFSAAGNDGTLPTRTPPELLDAFHQRRRTPVNIS